MHCQCIIADCSLSCFAYPGAQFSRHAEVVFYPGNERLSIVQTGRGLDDHNHLTVDTALNGSVPFLPPGAEVTMDPFKETYHYYPSGEHCHQHYSYGITSPIQSLSDCSFFMSLQWPPPPQ